MKRTAKLSVISMLLIASFSHADPILISPGGQTYDGTDCGGCGPGLSAILAYLNTQIPGFSSTESYKSDEDGDATGDDSGPAADLYTTMFSPVGGPSAATITWDGGNYLSGVQWLLVKDGNNMPIWYLFDISGWDGMASIELSGFWLGSGAISHVSLWGGVSVPEPGTLALFAIGLAGMGFMRRRRLS